MDLAYSLDDDCWEYLDPKGVKRGPFSGHRMHLWYESKMLPEDLGVRHTTAMPFIPIRELFPAALPPFKSRPRPAMLQASAAKCQCHWQYCDTKGQLQGPFTSAQMAQWFEHGMLPKSLQLRRTTDTHFSTISEYFPRPLVPFQSPPMTPVMPSAKESSVGALGGMPLGSTAATGPLVGISLGSGMAAIAAARAAAAASASAAKAAALAPCAANAAAGGPSTGRGEGQGKAPAKAVPAGAAAAAAAPQPLPKQAAPPKGKAQEPKAKAAAKAEGGYPAGNSQAAEDTGGKGKGKNNGKSEPPVGAPGGRAANQKGGGKKEQPAKEQQQDGWDWPEQGWSASDKAWWDWSSWNGWAADGTWDGNGKQQGTEWKGKGGETNGPIGSSPQKDKGGDRGNVVQAAVGNLPWGPHAEAVDLFPEEMLAKVQDQGIVWEERWICPLMVRFSQGKIHPFFHGRGPISEVMLQIRLQKEEGEGAGAAVRRIEPPFPPIRLLHLKEQGVLVTLDNRRLYALQRFALQEWPTVCLAKALCVDELTPTRLRAEIRKFTTRLCGLQLEVESRSNAFDTFSWVTDAAHAEAPKFCRPIAFKVCDKAISLLPMLVVHTLMCPRLRPLLQSRWPLLRLMAMLVRSPQRREFQTKRLLLHHVLELPKPSRRTSNCPPLCVGYKAETVVTLSKGKSCVTSKITVNKPLQLLQGSPVSHVQCRVLTALLPLFCLPYARSVLKGDTRDWIEAFLLAWGKIALAQLRLPQSV